MAEKIWASPGNPPTSVARRLGITRPQLREAIHAIKHEAKLGPQDRVTIWDDGTVTDSADDWIGNIHHEI